MGPLRRYRTVLNGMPTTVQLTEKDALRLGATLADEPAEPPPAEPPPAEPPPAEPLAVDTKARQPANKARTAKDKNPA